jgi:twitching motility protein PilT
MSRIDAFLKLGREQDCSDIHITVGAPPLVRLDGELIPLKYRDLSPEETESLLEEILDDRQLEELSKRGAVDLAYRAEDVGRFRINVSKQLRGLCAVCRVVPDTVPKLERLGLPPFLPTLADVSTGLILVTGTAGTGKSTTLAALVNEINTKRHINIITLEDPIEFVHTDDQAQVVQREIGQHVPSFADGLRSALREDPDVILVGELRDIASISLAIEAAETGHLVLGTMHTRGAFQTVHRIVDAYPTDAQAQIRHTLADTLRCVVSQELVRVADGRGRRVVAEIMVMTTAVGQLIREGKNFQIPQAMATGKRHGMQLMDQALLTLVQAGDVDPDEAFIKAGDKREFIRYVTDQDLLKLVDPLTLRQATGSGS